MIADIYANKKDGTLTILHNKPFDDVLLELVYTMETGELLFRFQNKEQYFGLTLLDEFQTFFKYANTVTLLQMDMTTKQAVSGMEVPVAIV